jgi:hypothetical protein
VPSGDPPLGTGKAHELSWASVACANLLPVPPGLWPDGTGGSPVLPLPTSETFVLDMGQPVEIAELARQMIELSGLKPEVDIEIKFVGLRPG